MAPAGHAATSGQRWFCGHSPGSIVNAIVTCRAESGRYWLLRIALERDEEQRRNRTDAEGRGEVLALLGIDLVDVDPVPVFGRQLLEHRSERFAGAAPRGVEVYERRLVAEVFPRFGIVFVVGHLLQEIGLVQCDRFHIRFLVFVVIRFRFADARERQKGQCGRHQFFHAFSSLFVSDNGTKVEIIFR